MSDPAILADSQTLISILKEMQHISKMLSQEKPVWEIWLPATVGFSSALVALVVGVLSHRNANRQIITSQEIAIQQMENNKESAIRQIEEAYKLELLRTRDTLVANSRREWIKEFRECVVKLNDELLKIHDFTLVGTKCDADTIDNIRHISMHIELMTNKDEEKHKSFILDLHKLMYTSYNADKKEANESISELVAHQKDFISSASEILKEEWEKVKALS
ncbi:MAG: hypothetical protein HQL43_04575 [Alphaproteobacteria bacterium]|nr:hypothetical protein [Alphaproteobacteria bacterium]